MQYLLSRWKDIENKFFCVGIELADISCVINTESFMFFLIVIESNLYDRQHFSSVNEHKLTMEWFLSKNMIWVCVLVWGNWESTTPSHIHSLR
jgi:hypothetical protein